ncbi:CbbQ/NirQ/NorQ/GpvN family protein [Hylemonella gracilis]|uniref:ATPase n=1 Tax=Hylemonella gracilis ATCC 19624 TaxID=887062 RepID=F3KP31_9BURK|nr:CbbQ/NirQ/NorQ/GpvN family protein [Hylemonella gracilis]EGI78432.1 ATPase [Hylemonella gracilis ATCC 19624]
MNAGADPLAAYRVDAAPWYRSSAREVELYERAWVHRLPLLLKGPTGCGKTRFVEHMAWKLGRPLVTVACNEDMTAADLVGRWLLDAQGTVWQDGPLTLAARHGAICYLDEVVEARQDTTVVIHPLTDARRLLPLDRKGELLRAHADFQLVVSYNPGYQSQAKDLKPSTRQRFAALAFDYPPPEVETDIVAHEAGVTMELAARLVGLARRTRALREHGLEEGASTRMLVYAGRLIRDGMDPRDSCAMTLTQALTDDPDLSAALRELVHATFP